MGLASLILWTIIVLPILGIIYIAIKFRKSQEYFKKRNVPYIGAGLGRTFRMVSGSISLVQAEDELYKDILETKSSLIGYCDIAGKINYITNDPELIKNILIKNFDHFLNRRQVSTQHGNKYMQRMVVFMEGDKWRAARTRLSPTFTSGRMRKMFQIFAHTSQRMEDYLKRHMNYPSKQSVDLDFTKVFSKYALDVIANVVFNIDSQSFEVPPDQLSTFEKMAKKFGFIFSFKFLLKFVFLLTAPRVANFFGVDAMDREATSYITSLVKSTVEKRRETGERREDFLQLMLDVQQGLLKEDEETAQVMMGDDQANNGTLLRKTGQEQNQGKKVPFDDDDVVANSMNFLTAGFDTTQSLMYLAAYTLALEPEIQEKLHEEVTSVLERHGGKLSYDAVSEMSYLEMFIQETLRLYAPATRTERICTMDYKVPGTDVVIKKGEYVMFPIRGIHKDPRYYPDPEKFIPERFSNENKATRSAYVYLPFGHGPRNCIGMRFALIKVKAVVAQLAKSFRFAPCSKTEIPMQFSNNAIIKPKNDMWLNVSVRGSN